MKKYEKIWNFRTPWQRVDYPSLESENHIIPRFTHTIILTFSLHRRSNSVIENQNVIHIRHYKKSKVYINKALFYSDIHALAPNFHATTKCHQGFFFMLASISRKRLRLLQFDCCALKQQDRPIQSWRSGSIFSGVAPCTLLIKRKYN